MRPILESVLFRTSAASDVQCSGGVLTVAGLSGVKKKNILSIKQVKYRAEVVQVATVSTTFTPVGSTPYSILIGDENRQVAGAISPLKKYTYVTPASITDLGATAALQREAINVALIAKINADASNYVVAATSTGGAGFTVTDDAGYYPPQQQGMTNRKGASTVLASPNEDGSGMPANAVSITTAAVYSNGVGADLLLGKPVIDQMYGNLIQGSVNSLFAPPLTSAGLAAVSGQNYDAFVIESLYDTAPAHNQTGQYALVPKTQTIWVDNGTGSSTANLAGFKAFERALLEHVFAVYATDPNSIISMGNTAAVCQGLATGLPSGVAQAENVISFGNGFAAHYSPIATSTLLALISTNNGIGLILDATASEGVELSAPTWANSAKEFVVGKTAFSVYGKITIDDVSGLNPLWFGFRKKEAYGATWASYTDYAAVGLGNATGDIFTTIELNGGGNTNTDTTVNWADGETRTLEVRVSITGVVTFYVDGAQVNSSTSFTFDSGDSIIPTIYALQTADIGTPSLLEWAAVAGTWRS